MLFFTFLITALCAQLTQAQHTCYYEVYCNSTVQSRSLVRRQAFLEQYGTWTIDPNSCWSDLVDNLRALNDIATGVSSTSMTIEGCLDACANMGLNLAGVEYSRECFCGNTIIGDNRPIDPSKCNMVCTGNINELCGGAGALNLYVNNGYQFTEGPASLVELYNDWTVNECWEDYSLSNRLLPYFASQIPHDELTVQRCIDTCAGLGYTSAGVEYGQECYCGNNTYPIGQSTTMDECNMACLGDATQLCGGPLRLIGYEKQAVYNGIIQVIDTNDNTVLGYISRQAFSGGIFQIGDMSTALTVQTLGDPQIPEVFNARLKITGAATDTGNYPFLGFIQGRDDTSSDLSTSSYNYLYIGATNPTNQSPYPIDLGSYPQTVGNSYTAATGISRTSESDVWTIYFDTGTIYPSWENSYGSRAPMNFWIQNNVLYAGSSPSAFNALYTAPITPITFKWISQ